MYFSCLKQINGGGGGGPGGGSFSKWQFTVFPDERIVIKITGFESCFGGC